MALGEGEDGRLRIVFFIQEPMGTTPDAHTAYLSTIVDIQENASLYTFPTIFVEDYTIAIRFDHTISGRPGTICWAM